jgi:hypothetical protein
LSALADDAGTICTMRNCGDMKPYGLALVGDLLVSMLRDLVDEGLIEAESEYVVVDHQLIEREPHLPLATSDDDLKRYWFVLTRAGWAALEAGADGVRAYYVAHPLEEDRYPFGVASERPANSLPARWPDRRHRRSQTSGDGLEVSGQLPISAGRK